MYAALEIRDLSFFLYGYEKEQRGGSQYISQLYRFPILCEQKQSDER